MRSDGCSQRAGPCRSSYSTATAMPSAWTCLRTSPSAQTPGLFMSTTALTRSAGASRSMGTRDLPVVGRGLQSVARREIEGDRRDIDLIVRRGHVAREREERGSQADEGG